MTTDQAVYLQDEGEYNVHISSSGSWQSEMSSTPSDRSSPSSSSGEGTRETEVNNVEVEPTMLETIQMGFSGQNGFKRFKWIKFQPAQSEWQTLASSEY